jgi:hypothetical protein
MSTVLTTIDNTENDGHSNHNSPDSHPFPNGQPGIMSISSLNYELVPLCPPSSNSQKRTYDEHAAAVNTSSSPTKKKARLHAQSSIRKAIEEGKPRGLLQYFKKATEEEHQAYLDRTTAEAKENAENEQWNKDRHEKTLQVKKRLRARERKRKQRGREVKEEISCGLRSPGGTKIKVSIFA